MDDPYVVISQPFWPAYLTAERIAKAHRLKLAITAGIGSDHVDLAAAMKHDITVAEVTFSNSISVAEHKPRYAAGTREILECWLEGRPIRDEYQIVQGGGFAGTGASSYSPGGK